jgi:hypothetical protein
MAIIVIEHPVADFEGWKRAFESDPLGRAKNGVTGHSIYRPADGSSDVVVTLEFATREQAERFMPALRELWRRAADKVGLGSPDAVKARDLDEVERVRY